MLTELLALGAGAGVGAGLGAGAGAGTGVGAAFGVSFGAVVLEELVLQASLAAFSSAIDFCFAALSDVLDEDLAFFQAERAFFFESERSDLAFCLAALKSAWPFAALIAAA